MATSEAQKKASVRWQAAHYRRIPLDVYPEEHERLKKISAAAGQSLNGWIKTAIAEKIERDASTQQPEP